MGGTGTCARARAGVDGVRARVAARSLERRRHPSHESVRLVDGLRRSRRSLHVRFADQWIRTWETVVLGLLWLVALWVTRKPVAR